MIIWILQCNLMIIASVLYCSTWNTVGNCFEKHNNAMHFMNLLWQDAIYNVAWIFTQKYLISNAVTEWNSEIQRMWIQSKNSIIKLWCAAFVVALSDQQVKSYALFSPFTLSFCVFVLLPFCSQNHSILQWRLPALPSTVSLTYFSIIHCSLVYVNAFIK